MKKKMQSILSLALAVLMLMSVIPLTASAETTADGFTYTISNNEATITGYEGTSTDLIIPSTVDGYPVVAIGDSAFLYRSDFTGELVIPEGVTTIGNDAFHGCSGFRGDLVIPEGVITIGDSAFTGCGFNGKLVIPEGVTTIGYGAFYGCYYFTGDLIIPEGVTTIEDRAFCSCRSFTGKLVIPEGVTSIGYYAFFDCSGFTGELVIPEGVTMIEGSAFYNCSGFTGDLIIPEGVITIEFNAFYGCYGFTGDLVIPDTITTIREGAFTWATMNHVAYTGTEEQWNKVIVEDNTFKNMQYLHLNYNAETDVTIKEFAGTCQQEGYKAVVCTCGFEYSRESIGFGEHSYDYTDVVAPTCVEQGYTTYSCICGDSYVADYVEPTGEHNWETKDKLPACAGGIATYYCRNCSTSKTEEIAPTEEHRWYTNENLPAACVGGTVQLYCENSNCNATKSEYIAPTEEHSWYTYDNIPSCAGGTATYYCRNCSTSKTEEIAPTEEHWWYTNENLPAACVGGTVQLYCANSNCNATKNEYVAPTEEHNFSYGSDYGDVCCEGGYASGYCEACCRYYDVYIEAEGHDWYCDIAYLPPCFEGTVTNYYRCSVCNATKSEYAAPTEEHSYMWDDFSDDIRCEGGYANLYCTSCYNYYDTYIEAEGHSYYYVSDNNATCTKDGTLHEFCPRCEGIGETVVDVGSKLGHDFGASTVLSQQSCTQDGISVQVCKRCSEITATIEGAYGHFDNDGDGKCDECKVVLEVILPDVPSEPGTDVTPENPEHTHSFAREVIFAPGCVTAGEQEFTCSCGEIYRAIIPANGHTDENADGVCDVCTEDLIGNDTDSDADSDAESSGFISKILEFFKKIAEFFKKLFGMA